MVSLWFSERHFVSRLFLFLVWFNEIFTSLHLLPLINTLNILLLNISTNIVEFKYNSITDTTFYIKTKSLEEYLKGFNKETLSTLNLRIVKD